LDEEENASLPRNEAKPSKVSAVESLGSEKSLSTRLLIYFGNFPISKE
jgi:hypothetical protein